MSKQPQPHHSPVFYEHTMADGSIVQYERAPEYINTGDASMIPFWYAKQNGLIREWRWTEQGWVLDGYAG